MIYYKDRTTDQVENRTTDQAGNRARDQDEYRARERAENTDTKLKIQAKLKADKRENRTRDTCKSKWSAYACMCEYQLL